VVESLAMPMDLDEDVLRGGASIGIAVGPAREWSTETMLDRADNAMYVAKRGGGNRWELAQVG
jgi:predicted signal transduction protein with EAL and GGDEF domain